MPQVTLKGNPVTLVGGEVKVGDKAPDFKLQSNALEDVTLASSAGKYRIIASVPSLDTAVCSLESKKFNDEASKLNNAQVYVVSMDLPFGQKRWCGAEGVENLMTLSDHRSGDFGTSYGVLIKGGGLDRCHCRAIFVIDPADKIVHVEYVSEIASEPNYQSAIQVVK